jgi:hypothetical protein
MARRVYRDKPLRLTDLVERGKSRLFDVEADRCQILGPAVILLGDDIRMSGNTWDHAGGGIDALIWDVPDGRTVALGGLRLERCTFTNCRFVNVGIAGHRGDITRFLEASQVI